MRLKSLFFALAVVAAPVTPSLAQSAAPAGSVQQVQWSAITVTADQFKPMRDLAASLGLYPAADQPNFAVFVAPNGSLFEIYGPGSPKYPWQQGQGGVATGFLTDDLAAAVKTITANGGVLVGDVYVFPKAGADGGDYGFQLFRAPDQRIYAIAQNKNFKPAK